MINYVQCDKLISMHEDALDTDDETVDPSFDLDSSVRSDSDHLVGITVRTGLQPRQRYFF